MSAAVPIHDNHFHCKPDGWKGLQAIREFKAAGGTSIAHVRLPSYPTTVEQFVETCRDHIAFGEKIRAEGIAVHAAIGPYPLEPLKLAEREGWDAAMDFGRACFDACVPFFEEGQAVCMGEIGRPHFEVDEQAWARSNELLEYGLGVAKDAGVPAMLHTEHSEPDTMLEFAQMADRAGLARDRVIKHYCGPLVGAEENHGLLPSVIAGRSNIRKALAKGDRFLLETDYIDEPTRPNVVMPCDTVPKRILGLMQNGELSESVAWKIGDELPRSLYG
ncbi:MAG: TatD family hydrolase [Thermoplasmatota archaeon]